MVAVFFSHSLPYCLRKGLSVNLIFTVQLDWLTSELWGSAYIRPQLSPQYCGYRQV